MLQWKMNLVRHPLLKLQPKWLVSDRQVQLQSELLFDDRPNRRALLLLINIRLTGNIILWSLQKPLFIPRRLLKSSTFDMERWLKAWLQFIRMRYR